MVGFINFVYVYFSSSTVCNDALLRVLNAKKNIKIMLENGVL